MIFRLSYQTGKLSGSDGLPGGGRQPPWCFRPTRGLARPARLPANGIALKPSVGEGARTVLARRANEMSSQGAAWRPMSEPAAGAGMAPLRTSFPQMRTEQDPGAP